MRRGFEATMKRFDERRFDLIGMHEQHATTMRPYRVALVVPDAPTATAGDSAQRSSAVAA